MLFNSGVAFWLISAKRLSFAYILMHDELLKTSIFSEFQVFWQKPVKRRCISQEKKTTQLLTFSGLLYPFATFNTSEFEERLNFKGDLEALENG